MPWRAAVVSAREVGHDLGRSGDVEGTTGLQEVALGINVEEYQGAFEHGLYASQLTRGLPVPDR